MRVPARFSVVVGAALALLGGVRRAPAAAPRPLARGAERDLRGARAARALRPALRSAAAAVLRDDPVDLFDASRPTWSWSSCRVDARHRLHVLLDAPLGPAARRLQRVPRATSATLMDGWKALPAPDVDRLLSGAPARRTSPTTARSSSDRGGARGVRVARRASRARAGRRRPLGGKDTAPLSDSVDRHNCLGR